MTPEEILDLAGEFVAEEQGETEIYYPFTRDELLEYSQLLISRVTEKLPPSYTLPEQISEDFVEP